MLLKSIARISPALLGLIVTCSALPLSVQAAAASSGAKAQAKEILDATGVKGGIVLQLGCGNGELTAALRANDSYQVQGLDRNADTVAKTRSSLYDQGVYGPVAVEQLTGNDLPYIDNFVNLVVAEDLGGVPMSEVMRVLTPNGVAYIKEGGAWKKTVKPRPTNIDEWTHYFYDAKGNTASKDYVVGPPRQMQWVGSPRWSRHHDRMSSLNAQVSAGGRLYYIMDEGSRMTILTPSKWTLFARDAFNGTVLWKKLMDKWSPHLWPLKTGPTQLTRRLVAAGDKIFVTLGIEAPVTCIDGATGTTIRTYEETTGAEEILHVDGVIYTLVNPKNYSLNEYAPKLQSDQGRVANEYAWDEKPRRLVAVDAASGRTLWRKDAKVAPLTMATDGKHLIYTDGTKIICLNPATGTQQWVSAPVAKRKLFEYNYGPRMLISSDVVLYAGGDGTEKGFDLNTGKELWTGEHQKSGYRSPEDLIVAGGLVWNAPTTSGTMSGEFSGRDIHTGQVKSTFPPDIDTYWFHHRCYMAKATERFLMPSRTGIEFVDFNKKHWDINHWVRAACLYGTMPCNGLTYAGPHNCACYPEAKLDGMNALAAASTTPLPKKKSDAERLEKGPAYSQAVQEIDADAKDWPTYRHDAARSGHTSQPLVANLDPAWNIKLGGNLSALSIAAGKVFVAQVDQHTVHAIDAATGKPVWKYIAGARVDSPPTYWKGRVLFGCKDGYVYCLRAQDGALIWRFEAAPHTRRHAAWEQVESVWPVHGSVLVENGIVSCVSGRSIFLDGGLHFIRLEAATGKKVAEVGYDEKDPENGKNIQTRLKTLQMPVGLNDILSSDGKYIYLRSQKILADGKRIEIGPVSGNAAEQGGAQKGEGAHIFAPYGYLDDSWFHRSYWVYGKNFAGGHNGYYQAGKYAPSGNILVFDDKNVYGYGREAQYFKWTTTMERQMFSAPKEAPNVAVDAASAEGKKAKAGKAGKAGKAAAAAPTGGVVKFGDDAKLDPSNQPLTVSVWIEPQGKDGVIVHHGGSQMGYALGLQNGCPGFSVRAAKEVEIAQASRPLGAGWHHVAGILSTDKKLRLYVDGQLAAETKAPGLIANKPHNGLQLGAASSSLVSNFGSAQPYHGLLDQFALFHKALDAGEIARLAQGGAPAKGNGLIVLCNFDNGNANDESGNKINGTMGNGVETGKGKSGVALSFGKGAAPAAATAGNAAPAAPAGKAAKGSFVEHQWDSKVPLYTRAMAMAGKTLVIAGPPHTMDEEYAFERLSQKDKAIETALADQDAALNGKKGALFRTMSSETGKTGAELNLEALPVWDGMSVAQGKIFIATQDGKITCFGQDKK